MSSFVAFAKSHPEMLVYLLATLCGAIARGIGDKAPRLAAALSAVALDVPKLIGAIKAPAAQADAAAASAVAAAVVAVEAPAADAPAETPAKDGQA